MTITSIELQHIIQQAFGRSASPVDVQQMPTGTVNRTALVTLDRGYRCIIRIGPGQQQITDAPSWLTSFGLRRELAAIALLQSSLDILPVTLAHDFSRDVIDGDWVVQQVMPGTAWPGIVPGLPRASQHELWRHLGDILRRIHAISGESFGPPAWSPPFPTWPDLLDRDLEGLAADAARYHLDLTPFTEFRQVIDTHRGELSRVPARLIHSDLTFDHLFVTERNGQWQVSGIIDLEFARFADIVSESVLLDCLARHDAMSDAFFSGYGDRPDVSELRQTVAGTLHTLWGITDAARLSHPPS